jgi:serine/threonine protein kinase
MFVSQLFVCENSAHHLTAIFSAKHLHSSEEQLHSMAGSFGYVAPEVLNRKGHGKPVDIWSTGYALTSLFTISDVYSAFSVITYVLLCGYAPFRSEDPKELVRETMAAKIEFHDRYWKNVSQEGAITFRTTPFATHTSTLKYLAKNFIKSLLNPVPPNDQPRLVLSLITCVFGSLSPPAKLDAAHSGLPSTPRLPRPTCQVSAKTSTHVPAGSQPSTPPGLSSGSTPVSTLRNSMDPTVPSDQRFRVMTTTMMTVSPFRLRGNRVRRLRRSPLGRLDRDWVR